MDSKQIEIRAILNKLSGGTKRKREDLSNPLVAFCRALFIPHFHAETTPNIPFDCIQGNIYNVEGNPPHKMLELHPNYFEFI
jgi:hypothetical protein